MRRRNQRSDFGLHLRSARLRAGLNLSVLAKRCGVSLSTLSRFESGASHPGFGDVCDIARALGAPLLFLADGRDRTGTDPRDLVAHLAYWGLNDLAPGETALIGEARPFEALIAFSLSDAGTPRITEAVPALLLKNDFSVPELEAQAIGARLLPRLGWAAELAEWISGQIPVSRIHPATSAKIRQIRQAAWDRRVSDVAPLRRAGDSTAWDLFGTSGGAPDRGLLKSLATTSPIMSKWKIAYPTPQEHFLTRARDILGVVEPG
jgi:transcriptional regulator with XRE-family HTH domain